MARIIKVDRKRSFRGSLTVGAVAGVAALFGLAGVAFGNAPNPTSEQVSATTAKNGTVTVTVSGEWDWGTITTQTGEKTSPQTNCAQRYGVGWAVDWADSSKAPWNDPATLQTYTITNNTGASFSANPNYDGMYLFNTDCATTQPHDSSGYPMGPWSAQNTYPSASAVPSEICVNFYDPHGQAGKPTGGTPWPAVDSIPAQKRSSDFVATGPNHDGDNSIQTNDYNPAPGGDNCAHVTVTPAPSQPSSSATPAPSQPSSAPAAPKPAPSAAPKPVVLGEVINRAAPAQPVVANPTFTG